jgi:hypothetical protein
MMWKSKKSTYYVTISNRFTSLENLDVDDDVGDICRIWESIRKTVQASAVDRLGYYELKQHKSCLDRVLKILRLKEAE